LSDSPEREAGGLLRPDISTVTESFLVALKENPDRTFGWFVDRTGTAEPMTWKHLGDEAFRFAGGLAAAGIRRGEMILIILPPSAEIYSLFFGIILTGAVPSILAFPSPRVDPVVYWRYLRGLVEHSGARWIVTYPEFAGRAAESGFAGRAEILIPSELSDGAEPLDPEKAVMPSPSDTLLLQHSSGTTGMHKGVALSHQAVVNQVSILAASLEMRPNDVIASWLPLYHDMGLIACFLLPALVRVPVVTVSPFDWVSNPVLLWRVVSRFHATLCWLPNFALEILARFVSPAGLRGLDLASLRRIVNCSEVCRPATHDAFSARYPNLANRISVSYAMAENTFAVTQTVPSRGVFRDRIRRDAFRGERRAIACDDPETQALTFLGVGEPLPGMNVEIRDSEGEILGDRCVGEIWIRSNCLLTGFHNRPDLDRELLKNGWYRTGDLGYLAGRELVVCGRMKEVIIQGGRNYYASDIEAVVSSVPGVKPGRAVAFGIPSAATGTEDIVVVAERAEDAGARIEEIERRIREDVAHHLDCMVNEVRVVAERWLVKTTSGKISREENRRRYEKEFGSGRADGLEFQL
jgi:fatty-acyl-CoA synthase